MANQKLKNIKAVITGSSHGLGRATAIRFAEQGARVALISRNRDELLKTRDIIKSLGKDSWAFKCDLGNPEEVEQVTKEILTLFENSIDILVNIASGWITGKLETLSFENMREMIDVTIVGTMNLTKSLLPSLRRGHHSRIINISSIDILSSPNPLDSSVPFISAKHGIAGFSAAIREELRNSNIRVTTICPGPFYTNSSIYQDWQEVLEKFGKDRMPIRDVVDSIIFSSTLSPSSNIDTLFIVPFTQPS